MIIKKILKLIKLKNIKIDKDEYLFHAGTKIENDKYLAIGGRVLNVIATTKILKNQKKSFKNFK